MPNICNGKGTDSYIGTHWIFAQDCLYPRDCLDGYFQHTALLKATIDKQDPLGPIYFYYTLGFFSFFFSSFTEI